MRCRFGSAGFSAVAVVLVSATACFGLSPAQLRTEIQKNPIGIGEVRPQFSWIDTAAAGMRGQSQSAYRIVVAATAREISDNRTLLWDTGKVLSDESLGIIYSGKPLRSRQAAVWAVEVWDQDGKPSSLSDPATFELGLLNADDWHGSWIVSAAPAPAGKPTFRAPLYLRKSITIDKPVLRARLYATALGLYNASIDAKKVGDAVLAPDWTDYHQRVRYQTFDVTGALTAGPHVLGATLADGWYSGHLPWAGYQRYGDRPALREQLVIDYTDGSSKTIATDSSWKTSVGPLQQSDIYDGEDYDARKELTGWNTPGYVDHAWTPAAERNDTPKLDAQAAPPVRKLMELPAKSVTEPKHGQFTFDFGQNMVGVVRLQVSAAAGTKVTLRYAEMLNPDGTVYTTNLRGARATDTYIFKGDGVESFTPSFTFHGFRYVEVSGVPAAPAMGAVTGVVIGSANPQSGEWTSSSNMLNRLQSNIVWGQRGNYLSIPTDCPQRDERLGWMGDAQVFVHTATFNADVQGFFDSWMTSVADAQLPDGSYTKVSPNILDGPGGAAWADAGVICPWTIYQVYGDKRLLERQYESMAKYIAYLKSHSTDLVRPDDGFGDWLSIDADTPKDLLATAYFAYSTRLMSNIADVLHKPTDSAKYTVLYGAVRSAFRHRWVKPDSEVTGNTQTSYLLALKFDLLEPSERAAAVDRLVADIHAKRDHLSTGFVGVSYLLPMLSRFSQSPLAYTLLNQDTFPSWLFSVKHGATTIWERWDGWTPEKGFQTPTMNSFNHYSLGSCGEWMYDTAAGLGMDPTSPGFKQIVFRPTPGGGLTSASATYHSVRGPVACAWSTNVQGLHVSVGVPPNSTATLHLPANKNAAITESGAPVASVRAVREIEGNHDRVFALPSGDYQFDVPLRQ